MLSKSALNVGPPVSGGLDEPSLEELTLEGVDSVNLEDGTFCAHIIKKTLRREAKRFTCDSCCVS